MTGATAMLEPLCQMQTPWQADRLARLADILSRRMNEWPVLDPLWLQVSEVMMRRCIWAAYADCIDAGVGPEALALLRQAPTR